MTSTRTTLAVLISSVSLLLSAVLAGSPAAKPDYQTLFPVQLAGQRVPSSSIALGDFDGNLDVVVGGADGIVHAYYGTSTELLAYDTGAMAIESKDGLESGDLAARSSQVP